MTREYNFEKDISKIESHPGVTLDEQTLKALHEHMKELSGCVNEGPLSVCYKVDIPKITVTLSAFGITIGTITLDPTNPCQTISLDLGIVSGSAKLCIEGSCLKLSGKICKFGSCTNWNDVTIVCWG